MTQGHLDDLSSLLMIQCTTADVNTRREGHEAFQVKTKHEGFQAAILGVCKE